MKILYLYTEVMGYNLPVFQELVNNYGARVEVVHWNRKKLTPYVPTTQSSNIRFHERFSFTAKQLVDFASDLRPDLVYVSGWQDRGYFPVLKRLKRQGAKIVMGLDSQWVGSVRQQIGAMLIRWCYKPRYFHYAWVPGPLQYAYANRIGFATNEIITHLLTADTQLFSQAALELKESKATNYPKQFLYVGRLTEPKGIYTLIKAFDLYQKKYSGDWGLTFIGTGPLEKELNSYPAIAVLPFMTQQALAAQAKKTGAFILPSLYEPWGVVAHEFGSAGLPLILSDKVGSRQQFLVDQLNGYVFAHGSVEDLAKKMFLISSSNNTKLIEMGRISSLLSCVINPQIAAASFVSVIEDHSK